MCLTITLPFWSFVFCFCLRQKPYVHDLVQADAFEALERKETLDVRVLEHACILPLPHIHTHSYKVDPTGWICTGEGDRFIEHGEIGPRQDGRLPLANTNSRLHGLLDVISGFIAHTTYGRAKT